MKKTFNELANVNAYSKDIDTGEDVSFDVKWRRVIESLGGLKCIIDFIPFSYDELKEAHKTDVHFNNLQLKKWDIASGFNNHAGQCHLINTGIAEFLKSHVISYSNADVVCLLKSAARAWIEDEHAEFLNDTRNPIDIELEIKKHNSMIENRIKRCKKEIDSLKNLRIY